MPHTVRKGKIPKPIQAMKDKLGENCTTESIMEVDPKLRKSALTAFDRYISKNHSEQYGEYQKIEDNEKKREWMACFINDGDEGLSRMTNTFSRQVTQRDSPASNPIPIRPKVYYRGLLAQILVFYGRSHSDAAIIFHVGRASGQRRCGG